MKYLVLSAKKYDFENKEGKRISGVKLSYVSKISVREGEFGNPPLIVNCSNDVLDEKIVSNLPAVCDLEFEQVVGRNNKPELVLVGSELVAPVDLGILFDN